MGKRKTSILKHIGDTPSNIKRCFAEQSASCYTNILISIHRSIAWIIRLLSSGQGFTASTTSNIIWSEKYPKYRRAVLKGVISVALRNILTCQCKNMGLELLTLEIMPDHIHLFVGAKPTYTPCDIVHQLKGESSTQLRSHFPWLKYLYDQRRKQFPSLWARGYYCGSAGHVSQEVVARYIAEQQGKKDVFEYNVFNNPDVKIGNFTQTKLGGFLMEKRRRRCQRSFDLVYQLYPHHSYDEEDGETKKKNVCWKCSFELMNGRDEMEDDIGDIVHDRAVEAYENDPINEPYPY